MVSVAVLLAGRGESTCTSPGLELRAFGFGGWVDNGIVEYLWDRNLTRMSVGFPGEF